MPSRSMRRGDRVLRSWHHTRAILFNRQLLGHRLLVGGFGFLLLPNSEVATARCVCRGLFAGTNPERAHGIKNMPWLPQLPMAVNRDSWESLSCCILYQLAVP